MNVSQGMMGVRWLQEEWKPNMAELEAGNGFGERKLNAQTKSNFFTKGGFSM